MDVEATAVPSEETCVFIASLMCRRLFNPIKSSVQAALHHLYTTEAKPLDKWYAVDAPGVRRGYLLIPGSAGMSRFSTFEREETLCHQEAFRSVVCASVMLMVATECASLSPWHRNAVLYHSAGMITASL